MQTAKIYNIVTDSIIQKLEEGTVPWHKPWTTDFPKNLVSKKEYTGINSLLLGMQEFSSPYWLTFNQCKNLGGTVKKGSKSTPIIFFNVIEKENKDADKEPDTMFVARYFNVFNTDQCEGLEVPEKEKKDNTPIEQCEEIMDNFTDKPEIVGHLKCACYSPSEDKIKIPSIKSFDSPEDHYATLFHESVHSTGHEKRLSRIGVTNIDAFGTEKYSKEELIAELGSCFLCQRTGILPKVIDNSASYIKNWLQALKDDRKMIVSAASQAQKAVDYITNNQ